MSRKGGLGWSKGKKILVFRGLFFYDKAIGVGWRGGEGKVLDFFPIQVEGVFGV